MIGDAAHAHESTARNKVRIWHFCVGFFPIISTLLRKISPIDWSMLWQHYHQQRRSSTQFYQFLSRLLTPLYQSDHCIGGIRDLTFPWMYQILFS